MLAHTGTQVCQLGQHQLSATAYVLLVEAQTKAEQSFRVDQLDQPQTKPHHVISYPVMPEGQGERRTLVLRPNRRDILLLCEIHTTFLKLNAIEINYFEFTALFTVFSVMDCFGLTTMAQWIFFNFSEAAPYTIVYRTIVPFGFVKTIQILGFSKQTR